MMRRRNLLLLLPAAFIIAGFLLSFGSIKQAISARPIMGKITINDPKLQAGTHVFNTGNFQVQIIATGSQEPRIAILNTSSPGHWLWYTKRGEAFVAAAEGQEYVKEERGSFFFQNVTRRRCGEQTIDSVVSEDQSVTFSGSLSCDRGEVVGYTLSFTAVSERQLAFRLSYADPAINRAYLTYASDADEHFYGFGEQFTYFDKKGHLLPIWASEQGIGRGSQPLTFLVNLAAHAGGSPYTTYAAVPQYITSKMRSLFLENSEYSVFDLRKPDRVQISTFSSTLEGRILSGNNPEDLIIEYTSWAGRMRLLPDWILSGAVIGMHGGTEKVQQVYKQLKEAGTPVSAFWLQDWVGQRITSFGKQLWWNWELDEDRYPGWTELRKELDQDGVRLMVYTSPFLADVSGKTNARRNLFKEAAEKGYLVARGEGDPDLIENTDFTAGLVDLTNPAASDWYKNVLRESIINQAGASGWMADFGEALPYDAVLSSGETGITFHNRYPEAWAQFNRELVDSLPEGDEIVFFQRAAFQHSPAYSTLFWEGDQLVAWDQYDGLKSAVTGLLSGGFSGLSLNHSDIGGYTTLNNPLARVNRSQELLMRWTEFSAFTTVFRTHEGNLPEKNIQFYSNTDTLTHFTRMAKVYEAWKPLRLNLVEEASTTGIPVARHLFLHYPDDPTVYDLSYQEYMLGSEFLVAPVLDPGVETLRVYLPAGNWVHVWSGRIYRTPYKGIWVTVPAPLGQPGIFYREGSPDGIAFRQNLEKAGLLK